MSRSTGKFELFMRGLACNIVGVGLEDDDRAAGTESCWSSLITTVKLDGLGAWCNVRNKTKSIRLRYLQAVRHGNGEVASFTNMFLVDRVV
jgi:hypothetical protein